MGHTVFKLPGKKFYTFMQKVLKKRAKTFKVSAGYPYTLLFYYLPARTHTSRAYARG